jgi:hypothetical protein
MNEFVKQLMISLMSIGGILIIWMFSCITTNTFFYICDLVDKVKLTIKLPMRKKYLTKVDPIFKMYQHEYDNHYYVGKWVLMYKDITNVNIWLFLLFPYPIDLQFYKFYEVNSYFLCKPENVTDLSGDLESIYNVLEHKDKLKIEKEEKEKNAKNTKIKELNKIFKENYE